jgi:hypothetical protein
VSRFASSAAASAALAVALCAIAFGGRGGFDLSDVTWVEGGMVAGGGLLVALAALRGRRGGRHGRLEGGVTLLLFAALALFTAASILWSVAPHQSWLASNLTVAYLAVFAGAMAIARLRADAVTVVLRALVLAAGVVTVYALLTRVFPELVKDEVFARLGQPYGYWNALGTTAAIGVPAALWLGSRRAGYQPANALAYPLLSLLSVALLLSYSRGAMIMAAIGAVLWVVLVPLRLRSITLLGVSLAGAAPVVVWALAQDAFTKNQVAQPVREAVATEFGLWLLATVLVTLAAGLAIGFRVARRPPRARARLRVGLVATVVACAAPIVMVAVLASSDRGLGGTIEQGYESLTSISQKTPGGPARLLTASSSRGLYWHQAKKVFLDHYWKGSGADSFAVTRLRYRSPKDQSVSQHAHGYLQQTAADLGAGGLALSLALAVAWLLAARRATGLFRRRRRGGGGRELASDWGPERIGLVALSLAAIVFGLHSLVDWIWFVPGPTAMAVAAAGLVAGRGAPRGRSEAAATAAEATGAAGATAAGPPPPATSAPEAPPARAGDGDGAAAAVPAGAGAALATLPPPTTAPASAAVTGNGHSAAGIGTDRDGDGGGPGPTGPADPDAPTAVLPPPPPPPAQPPAPPAPRAPRRLPPGLARAARPMLALLAIAVAALVVWSIAQPLRAENASDHALDLAADNRLDAARAAARHAHDIDPLTPRPYLVLSSIEDAAGNQPAVLRALQRAVLEFPGDPQTWLQLAQYQLNSLSKPADALATVKGALYLDPQSRAAQNVFFQASTALNPPPPTAPGTPPVTTPAPTTPPVPTAPAPPVTPGPTPGKPSLPQRSGGTPAPPGRK